MTDIPWKQRACKNCRYWTSIEGKHFSDRGDCRRHSPRNGSTSEWPQTSESEWCGEFRHGNLTDEQLREMLERPYA